MPPNTTSAPSLNRGGRDNWLFSIDLTNIVELDWTDENINTVRVKKLAL